MKQMFSHATPFNGDISNWDVSSVTTMQQMFTRAEKFNGDITNWDVSANTTMYYMFNYAKKFNQNIRYWQVKSDCTVTGMFIGSLLDDSNIMTNGAPDIATYFNLIKPFTHKLTNGRYKMVADTSNGKPQYDYTNDNHILIASHNGAKLKYVLDEIEVYNLGGNFFLGKENNGNIFKLDSSKNTLVTDWDIIGDGSHFLKFTYNGSEQTVNIISGPIVSNQYRIYQTSVTGKNFTY
jgi:surface protein